MKQFRVRDLRGVMVAIRPAESAVSAVDLQRKNDVAVAELKVAHARQMLEAAEKELQRTLDHPGEYTASEWQ